MMLVAVYVGGVLVLEYAFRTLTGSGSQLSIVASTLLIAALFNPMRRRIQYLIDHLFYRRKYDAARTLETFSARLRDETNLDTLGSELLSTVRETVQPSQISLWLRSDLTDQDSRARLLRTNRNRGALDPTRDP
jgi:hypothetical protein